MQRCPRCGVRNLDSDIVCFNCEELLLGGGQEDRPRDAEATLAGGGRPSLAETTAAVEPGLPRPAREKGKAPTFASLLAGTLLQKALGLLLAFGLFSIVALLAMWLDYTNPPAFFASLGVLAAASLAALLYPGIRRAGLNGRKGGLVALFSDLAILAAVLPPAIIYLEKKLSGASELILRYYWAIPALLGLDFLLSQLAGYLSGRRSAGRGASRSRNTLGA